MGEEKTKKILFADDHPVVREGLIQMLKRLLPHVSAEVATTGKETVRMAEDNDYDMVLLDISMPDMSGFQIFTEIKKVKENLPILFLSTYPAFQVAYRAIRMGAAGYINKDVAADEIKIAVETVLSGQMYISKEVSAILANGVKNGGTGMLHESLSEREFQILVLIGQGYSTSDIAITLNISVKTVGTHRMHILEKMNMQSNAELIRYVVENKLDFS